MVGISLSSIPFPTPPNPVFGLAVSRFSFTQLMATFAVLSSLRSADHWYACATRSETNPTKVTLVRRPCLEMFGGPVNFFTDLASLA